MNSTQSNAIAHVETTGIEVLSNVFYITNSLLDESLPSPTGQESHDALESMDWFQKGLFAYRGKRFDDAIHYFNEANAIQPNNAQCQYYLGNCFYRKKDFISSVHHYKKAIS